MLRNTVDYTKDPVFLCEAMDWNNPYWFRPIFGVLRISPGAVVILLGAAVIGQSICGKKGAVVGVLGWEEGIQQLHALVDAVIVKLRGWMGESGEAHGIKNHAGVAIWSWL